MTLRWDKSEVDHMATDLSKAPGRMQHKAPRVFAHGARATSNRLRIDATGHDFLGELPNYVSHEQLGLLSHEIGFEKAGQGNLAVFAVYGSINNAPVMASPVEHLRRELPEIERQLGAEGEDAVFGGAR